MSYARFECLLSKLCRKLCTAGLKHEKFSPGKDRRALVHGPFCHGVPGTNEANMSLVIRIEGA
jgi:hypothetical protein